MAKHILVEFTISDFFADEIAGDETVRKNVEHLLGLAIATGGLALIGRGETMAASAIASVFNAEDGGPSPRILTEEDPL